MNRAIVVVLTAVAVMFSGLAVAASAQATFGDSRACATNKEYRAVKKGMPKAKVTRILDGKGARVNAKTRQYTKCGKQQRVVRVTYNRKYGNKRAKVARKAQITALPSAPRNLVASAGDGTVRVSWQAPASSGASAVSEYRVQYRHGGGSWREQSTSARAVTLAGLSNGAAYDVRVSAVNSFGSGAASRAVTTTPSGVPSVVQNMAVAPMNESLQVDWAAPASTGGRPVTGYVVQWREVGGTLWTEAEAFADQRSVTITSLANGKQQQVRVAALNANGRGPAASMTGMPVGMPGAPQHVTLRAGDRSLEVTWTAPDLGGAPSAERVWVQYRAEGDTDWVEVELDGSETSHTLIGLANDAGYDVRVAYANSRGRGPWSPLVVGVPVGSPAIPSEVSGKATDNGLLVTWDLADDGGLPTEFRVSYRAEGTSFYNVSPWLSAHEYLLSDAALLPGHDALVSHEVQVEACNDMGCAASSPVLVDGHAQTLAFPSKIGGTIYNGQKSWYRVDLDEPTEMSFGLIEGVGSSSGRVDFYSLEGLEVIHPGWSHLQSTRTYELPAGVHYMAVSAYAPQGWWHFSMDVSARPDAADSSDEAVTLAVPGSVQGHVHDGNSVHAEDEDWYAIEVTTKTGLTVSVEGQDYALDLYRPDGSIAVEQTAKTTLLLDPGRHKVRVYEGDSGAPSRGATDLYALAISDVAAVALLDPSAGTTSHLEAGDTAWYEFAVGADSQVAIDLGGDVDWDLYDASARRVLSGGLHESVYFNRLDAGSHFIRVRAGETGTHTILLSMSPDEDGRRIDTPGRISGIIADSADRDTYQFDLDETRVVRALTSDSTLQVDLIDGRSLEPGVLLGPGTYGVTIDRTGPGPVPYGVDLQAYEPESLTMPGAVTGSVADSAETKWFQFELDAPTPVGLAAQARGCGGGCSSTALKSMALLDSDLETLASGTEASFILAPGRYYVGLELYGADFGTRYDLTAKNWPIRDVERPFYDSSESLNSNSWTYYRFSVDEATTLQASLTTSNSHLRVRLFDDAGQLLASGRDGYTRQDLVRALTAGQYYLGVLSQSSGATYGISIT